jgi:hypothetical protein
LKAHYQKKIESIKGKVTRLADLFEQVLGFNNGKGTSAQPPMKTPSVRISHTSQNLGANSVTGHHFIPFTPIYSSQTQIIVEPRMKGSSNNRSTNPADHDKWVALEERLRAIKEKNLIDPMIAFEVCLVPNIVVPKKFKVLDFIKYTGLECPNTHLWL